MIRTYLPHFLHGNTASGSGGGFVGALLFFAAGSARGLWGADGGWASLFTVSGSLTITIVPAWSRKHRYILVCFSCIKSIMFYYVSIKKNVVRGVFNSYVRCTISQWTALQLLEYVVKYLHSREPVVTEQPLPAGCSQGFGRKKRPSCHLHPSILTAVNSASYQTNTRSLISTWCPYDLMTEENWMIHNRNYGKFEPLYLNVHHGLCVLLLWWVWRAKG